MIAGMNANMRGKSKVAFLTQLETITARVSRVSSDISPPECIQVEMNL
jgi:hypothetical protein